jgi:hypothetical protein
MASIAGCCNLQDLRDEFLLGRAGLRASTELAMPARATTINFFMRVFPESGGSCMHDPDGPSA